MGKIATFLSVLMFSACALAPVGAQEGGFALPANPVIDEGAVCESPDAVLEFLENFNGDNVELFPHCHTAKWVFYVAKEDMAEFTDKNGDTYDLAEIIVVAQFGVDDRPHMLERPERAYTAFSRPTLKHQDL